MTMIWSKDMWRSSCRRKFSSETSFWYIYPINFVITFKSHVDVQVLGKLPHLWTRNLVEKIDHVGVTNILFGNRFLVNKLAQFFVTNL